MIHLIPATPERFSALAENPHEDLERLRANIESGRVDPAHLLIASESGDVGRVGLYRAGDGTMLTYAWLARHAHPGAETDPGAGAGAEAVYRVLAGGVADLVRRDRLAQVVTVVIDADADHPAARRRALRATGWVAEDDRLELQAPADKRPWAPGIEEISPREDAVTAVMSQAMSLSADTYDVEQVQAKGARRAAEAYRDMMADGGHPWLAHRGVHGIDGIAAIQRYPSDQRYPTDWCLGYLGVAPEARGQGVGTALATAMVSATAEAGIGGVTASVAVGNPAIRATLDGVGFTSRSPRTDFVIGPAG